MKRKMLIVTGILMVGIAAGWASWAAAQDKEAQELSNEKCPVMGGKVNPKIFTEHEGKKVYFCCPGCISKFKKNPEKYVGKLPQFGKEEELEELRTELRTLLKEIAEQAKMLHGEAAGHKMCKLVMEEMKRVSKETGVGTAGSCPMQGEMMEKCKKKGTCPITEEP